MVPENWRNPLAISTRNIVAIAMPNVKNKNPDVPNKTDALIAALIKHATTR